MSIGSALKSVLGFVAGILIPGASANSANLTHTIQQHFADLYGDAARAMANELKLDTTGMSGPDKVFAILRALVATAVSQGFRGDIVVLGHVLLDVAQAAFRASEDAIETELVSLATALHAGPTLVAVTKLVVPTLELGADHALSALGANADATKLAA